jgi:branched-chain amino acid transport system substrate-binding protein
MDKKQQLPAASGITRRRVGQLAFAAAAGSLASPAIITAARAATVLKIGQIEPLTGPSAAYGQRSLDGARMAVDAINAAGGFQDSKGNTYTIDVHVDDMANDARQAITLYRQNALNSDIAINIGPTNSVGYVPLVPIASQLKLVLVGEAGAPVKRWTPWAFRVNPVGPTAIPLVLTKVQGKLNFKRLAIIYDQTQDAQAGDAEVCRTMKAKLGYDIVADEAFSSGSQDFSAQITKIKAANPDAMFVASTTGDGVKVVPQIRTAGIDVPLMTGYGAFQDPLYWNGTNGAIKGCFTYGYDAIMCAVEAVKRAASTDREKIQEQMAALDYQSPLGTHLTFKNPPSGENITPTVTVIEVTGPGAYVAVA